MIVNNIIQWSGYYYSRCKLATNLQTSRRRKRLARATILLKKFKDDTGTDEIVFTDEKLFTVEAKFNRQKNRVLAKSSVDIEGSSRTVFRRQKSSSIMVWGGISKKVEIFTHFHRTWSKSEYKYVHRRNFDSCS